MTLEHKIKKQLDAMEEPYVYIDTAFIRKGKTMHQLYKETHKKRIKISKESLRLLNIAESLSMVQALIKEHHIQTQGDLGIFGTVRFYYYKDCDGNIYGFDKYGDRL